MADGIKYDGANKTITLTTSGSNTLLISGSKAGVEGKLLVGDINALLLQDLQFNNLNEVSIRKNIQDDTSSFSLSNNSSKLKLTSYYDINLMNASVSRINKIISTSEDELTSSDLIVNAYDTSIVTDNYFLIGSKQFDIITGDNLNTPATRLYIESDGRVIIGSGALSNEKLTIEGNIQADGIVFGSTTGSVTSKTLDDYEQGTFTPYFFQTGVGNTNNQYTYSIQSGSYVKVGKTCFVSIEMQLATQTLPSTTGTLRIGGLPFTHRNGGWSSVYTGFYLNFSSSVTVPPHGYCENNLSQIFLKIQGNGSSVSLTNAYLQAAGSNTYLIVSANYLVS